MRDFDIEKLERKNIYKEPDFLFENIQGKVLGKVNDFDLEKLERKNIYAVSGNVFKDVQNNVISKVFSQKKTPVFRMNWAYAAAASLALVFGATFVLNNNDSAAGSDSQTASLNKPNTKTDSETAYETLKSDLTSVENTNQTLESQKSNNTVAQNSQNTKTAADTENKTVKTVSKQNEAQMNDYLDSFSNSEISELASNANQDVYLDLYN